MSILVGDTTSLNVVFDVSGTPTDPTSITLQITDPLAGVTTYLWPSGLEIVHDSAGTFHYIVTPNRSGRWLFTWTAAGAVVDSSSGYFDVEPVNEALTVTVRDALTNLVPDVLVSVYANVYTLKATGRTASNGAVTFYVTPGTYVLDFDKPKYACTSSVVTVPETGGVTPTTLTKTVTALGIQAAKEAVYTRLFGHLAASLGSVEGTPVLVSIALAGANLALGSGTDTGVVSENLLLSSEHRTVTADSTGYWEIDVPQGSTVRVRIPYANFERTFRVPSVAALNIADARTDPGTGGGVGVDSDTPARDVLRGS